MKSAYSDAYAIVSGVLKQARLDAGWTQAELAKRLKRPQSFVAKYESGERRLDLVELVAIARVLSVRPSQMLKNIEKLM